MRGESLRLPVTLGSQWLISCSTKRLSWMRSVVAAIATTALFGTVVASAAQNETGRPFTVKDGIEISYIVNPAASTFSQLRGPDQPVGVPIISPDRKHFFLITQKGVLSTNRLEGTIWLFDREGVQDYVSKKTSAPPAPKPVATLRARSNTPVISEARWLDSQRIAFLGKRESPYQRVFIADLVRGSLTPVTKANLYVTKFDIGGDTLAYTTLITPEDILDSRQELVDVMGKGLFSLLHPNPRKIDDDLEEGELVERPSALHVQRNGEEVHVSFVANGERLKLFMPTLAVSPDGKYLITVAPVPQIPIKWGDYKPYVDDPKYMSFLKLKPGNKYALAVKNEYKASQYVLINLQTGQISPLVDAPAGRSLDYNIPTNAFWLRGSRQAVLSNTFLPLDGAREDKELARRQQAPAIAFVDVVSRKVEAITYLRQSPMESKERYLVDDVSWDEVQNEVTLHYIRFPDQDQSPVPPFETYRLNSGEWKRMPVSTEEPDNPDTDPKLSVEQDLNHSPTLIGSLKGGALSVHVWDPNPQLHGIKMVEVSVYRWQDKNGNSWSGLLVPPSDYHPKRRYPLVIQLYGYRTDKFFVDGPYTTGFSARALSGKGVFVLQIEWPATYFRTPQDGPFQADGFESAIEHLSVDGLIDARKVGIIGFSYSSYHALYAITHRPELFTAALFTDGNTVSYWQYLMSAGTVNSMQGLLEETNGGVPFGDGLQAWLHNAPGFSLDKTKTPLLISSFGPGSLIYHWEIYSALHTLKKPVDMVWLRKENWPHILVQPAHRYISQRLTVDWFSFWLTGEEDSDPVRAEQYARWRELRGLQEDNQKARDQTRRPALGHN